MLDELFGLFYPDVCVSCANKLLGAEKIICGKCSADLIYLNHWNTPDNKLMMRFAGRVHTESAAACFQFTKSSAIRPLIHALKYRSRQDVGEYLGSLFGAQLASNNSIFKNIELIVPVPLHWKKQKQRGYNQCDSFAQGLSSAMNIPWVSNSLKRNFENISQTKKKRYDRFGNVDEIFSVTDESILTGKHILLVDDVVTTGATSETCMQTLLAVPGVKVSFVAIAMAAKK